MSFSSFCGNHQISFIVTTSVMKFLSSAQSDALLDHQTIGCSNFSLRKTSAVKCRATILYVVLKQNGLIKRELDPAD